MNITKTQVIRSHSHSPYHNLALEEYLLDRVEPDTITLYLWQNDHTVVIGQNQNAWQECLVRELEEDGGHLARRLSGGGAVYHDLGNLNFTFLVPRDSFDVARQTEVIRLAAASYGLSVERTGRNDIVIQGRKFSGNAFYKRGSTAYHHGTILVDSDMTVLPRFLNVSQAKLASKGVKSVAARVANLREFCPEMTIAGMMDRLEESFAAVYGAKPLVLSEADCTGEALSDLEEKYGSWEWRFGRKLPFETEFGGRFPWGGVQIGLKVEGGRITDAAVYSDAMDSGFIAALAQAFRGRRYQVRALQDALHSVLLPQELGYEANPDMAADIERLLGEQNF